MKIEEAIAMMTYPQKVKVYKALKKSIMNEKGIAEEKEQESLMKDISSRVFDMLGIAETYNPKDRSRENIIARTLIANALLRKGYSEKVVGRLMQKNHSTIHWSKDMLSTWEAYPKMYEVELNYWKRLNEVYETE